MSLFFLARGVRQPIAGGRSERRDSTQGPRTLEPNGPSRTWTREKALVAACKKDLADSTAGAMPSGMRFSDFSKVWACLDSNLFKLSDFGPQSVL